MLIKFRNLKLGNFNSEVECYNQIIMDLLRNTILSFENLENTPKSIVFFVCVVLKISVLSNFFIIYVLNLKMCKAI